MAVIVEIGDTQTETRVRKASSHRSIVSDGVDEETGLVAEESVALSDQVGHEEIEPSPLFHVHGDDAHSSSRNAHGIERAPPQRGILFKAPLAPVQPELVGGGVIGHEEVDPAVVIEIARGDAEAIAVGAIQTGGGGDVFKGAVPSVAEEDCRGGSVVIAR